MHQLKKHKRTFTVYCLIITGCIIFNHCVSNEKENLQNVNVAATQPADTFKFVTYQQFAGSEKCAGCHKNISDEFMHNAHYFSSQVADEKSIKGSFKKEKNVYKYSSDRKVVMQKNNDSLYQVYYYRNEERVRRRFDIVIGSGTKGQTYLSWVNNQLIELPVSYFTIVNQWANSPGYPLYPTLFNRPATTRCMECHSTFASTLTPPFKEPEKFDSSKLILRITCEKCHGPAADHVTYHTQYPNDTVGRNIVNTRDSSRAIRTDLCALCHGGRLQKTKPSFTFIAGDKLSDYFVINTSQTIAPNPDVHGNQLGLLAASKCYKLSNTMTCGTCHEPHKKERGNKAIMSNKCMTCHGQTHSIVDGISPQKIAANCIDCHMPVQQSMAIGFLLEGDTTPTSAKMRTHYITVYPDETKQYVRALAGNKKAGT